MSLNSFPSALTFGLSVLLHKKTSVCVRGKISRFCRVSLSISVTLFCYDLAKIKGVPNGLTLLCFVFKGTMPRRLGMSRDTILKVVKGFHRFLPPKPILTVIQK